MAADHPAGGVRYLGPAEIRALAAGLGLSPTKKLGQNFVHDPNTVRRIVDAAGVGPGDHPVEVGPGLGSLTLALLDRCGRASAVEIDPRLAELLPATCAGRAPGRPLRVVRADALSVTAADLAAAEVHGGAPSALADPPTALVANLPYNVSVPVLLHMLAEFPGIRTVLVMVQAEVADRLAAAPGSRAYGVPSVKAAFHGRVRRAGAIGRNVFWPAPKVDSGLVRIDVFGPGSPAGAAPWPVDAATREAVWPLVDAAFAQRRKTLRAALAGHYGSAAAAEAALRAAGIDPGLRGERLGVADFVRLAGVGAGR
ncbi:16S rRNA (adenine(1518)-N(6)/adenine(1519)-N(6))-dimethyltransferase RsmA [Corynebacterium sphenisci]|uniref:16S rRNA (adenine(1518)-N(6)/adenine(1519)-N(6))- dimethyltransferase RsmA n=1 Tax=Corynebacterium sphenisci TaxID=191493 RepID=UPI0026E029F4|nr:16S rRNA (adenine(1518)-N(6)/adenine(1519)-N(6))-dimethyltransferase RsmA [Corynebacterium sphenisci]MDO5731793.1 16S rRNA (adenine(1518)-N(6)/adenine(1519)-N(6))-dimethyltransferase RsmA [Corynebacterium sphenisci]